MINVSVANQEGEAVRALSGVVCGFLSVSDHAPQLVGRPSAPGLSPEISIADISSFFTTSTTMYLQSTNLHFTTWKKTGAIVVSGSLIILAFVLMVLCFSQLGGEHWMSLSCVSSGAL